jgi:hypothetical protein
MMRKNQFLGIGLVLAVACASVTESAQTVQSAILFVTQVPIAPDFATIGSVFANHHATMETVGRGGDLYIRYGDGSLKNLTHTAGYGVASGMQGATSIAVRDPSVHWDGKKALFSMVVGAPTQQYQVLEFRWQIYEISNLEKNQTPIIQKIANQPNYNNVTPIYGTDDRIIFTSDRPRDNSSHLYPQRDEYESTPVVTGLWSLDRASGNLALLNHAPSGNFSPSIDSFGRVIFTQWDHLKRDQQADADKYNAGENGSFNYASEAANAQKLQSRAEIFPEPRVDQEIAGTNLNNHDFNQFFPWMILEDGTEGETLNHAGRHELMSGDQRGYIEPSLTDDPALETFLKDNTLSQNKNYLENLLQMREDPNAAGYYFGTNALEFGTHASGQLVRLKAAPNVPVTQMTIENITHPATAAPRPDNAAVNPNQSGLYRDPLPLFGGKLVAAHTTETRADKIGNSLTVSRYAYRLTSLKINNGVYVPDAPLTAGISKSLEFWSPDVKVTYKGNLWELQPVELRPRVRPARITQALPSLERSVFQKAGVNETAFRNYLKTNNLALAIIRNATTRDVADRQQPFNLRVPNGTETKTEIGKVYDVSNLQFLQADLIRGYGGTASPQSGRRVLAQLLHDSKAVGSNSRFANYTPSTSSASLASDGSVAAFVPARRAMTWQLKSPNNTPVVRERYWLTFQPGEVRVCTSCHGLNEKDQAGNIEPQNEPKALLELLQKWKAANP